MDRISSTSSQSSHAASCSRSSAFRVCSWSAGQAKTHFAELVKAPDLPSGARLHAIEPLLVNFVPRAAA
jgi:hypothetical protein